MADYTNKDGLKDEYCPHCDQFSEARVLLKQDELISAMYEALKIAEGRIYTEISHHPEAGDYRKMLQDELRQVIKARAKAEVQL